MKKAVEISIENGKRVFKGLGIYEPYHISNLKELVNGCSKNYGNKIGFKFKDKKGNVTAKSYNEFASEIDCLGTALVSLGLNDPHISILSENRYEWGVCFLSVVNGTGVVVPMDKYLPSKEVQNLVERGNVEVIFYSPTFHKMMKEIELINSKIKYFICMEEIVDQDINKEKFLSMQELIKKGKVLIEAGDKSFVGCEIDSKKMSILLFTSGTTSISKGVMLSHSNIASNVTSIGTAIKVNSDDVYLSLLPLHHTFENTVGFLFMISRGVCIAYCDGIKYIAQNIREYNVSLLVAVPAIFEAIYGKVMDGIKKSGKEKAFKAIVKVSNVLRKVGIDLRRKFFKGVYEQLGPNLRLAVSGAAPIDKQVIIGFDNIGIVLLQGYGLTETSPVVAANNDMINIPGTIGPPLGGVDVALDSMDETGMGELMVRGGNVMLGYYENPKATEEVLAKDGWLKTGDLAVIDNEGIIKITGRAKSMIVLTSGKKAFPEEYEILLNNIPEVKESFVWGNVAADGDVQICAKIVIDKEKIIQNGELVSEQEIAANLDKHIKEMNKSIPQYKIIRYFVMTYDELVKTTTLKIKRPIESENMKKVLDKAGVEIRKLNGKFI